ncbi:MAG TPA: TRAP transporter small permease [Deferrisomatales bacterium]|nr:TRAP transporter small permease [Deferrisomatales bacterium]
MRILQRALQRLRNLEELSLSLIYIGLALVAFVQVICRYAFNLSFSWFEEGGRYIGILVTFMGASIGVRYGTHFSMDLLATALKPRLAALLARAVHLVGGSFLLVIAYYGSKLVVKNYGFETTSPAMQIPMYLAYLPIPVFTALMAVRMFLVALLGPHRTGPGDDAP